MSSRCKLKSCRWYFLCTNKKQQQIWAARDRKPARERHKRDNEKVFFLRFFGGPKRKDNRLPTQINYLQLSSTFFRQTHSRRYLSWTPTIYRHRFLESLVCSTMVISTSFSFEHSLHGTVVFKQNSHMVFTKKKKLLLKLRKDTWLRAKSFVSQ